MRSNVFNYRNLEILEIKSYKWKQHVYMTFSKYQFIYDLLHYKSLCVLSLPI